MRYKFDLTADNKFPLNYGQSDISMHDLWVKVNFMRKAPVTDEWNVLA